MDWQRCYPDVSQVLTLHPRAAAAAFESAVHDPSVADVLIPDGALLRATPGGYCAMRALPCLLRPQYPQRSRRRGAHRLEVVLEVLPFSQRRSELVIRTDRRPGLSVERNVEAYLHSAQRALQALVACLDPACITARDGWHPAAFVPRPRHALVGHANGTHRPPPAAGRRI